MSHLVSQVNEPPFTNPNELCSTMLSKLEQVGSIRITCMCECECVVCRST